jgi:hypothetical protein
MYVVIIANTSDSTSSQLCRSMYGENKVLVDIFIFGFATVLIISHVKYALHYALNFVSMDTTKLGTKQKILKSL